jgi:hypothetical protein
MLPCVWCSASLSREDDFFGDNHDFNPAIYGVLQNSSVGGLHTLETAGHVRHARFQDSLTRNPDFTWFPQLFALAYGEAGAFLSVSVKCLDDLNLL